MFILHKMILAKNSSYREGSVTSSSADEFMFLDIRLFNTVRFAASVKSEGRVGQSQREAGADV